MPIEGKYTFTVRYDPEFSGYIATGDTPDRKGKLITQGMNEYELFTMVADAWMCLMDVKLPWHVRAWYRSLYAIKGVWWRIKELLGL